MLIIYLASKIDEIESLSQSNISQLDNYVSTLEDFDSDEETLTTSKEQISDEDIAEVKSEVKSDSEKSETDSEEDEKPTDGSSAEETDQDSEFDSE